MFYSSFIWNNSLFYLAAVAVNPELLYAVAEVQLILEDTSSASSVKNKNIGRVLKNGERKPFLIVASELIPTLESKWGVKLLIRKTFLGSALENCRLHYQWKKKKNQKRTNL